MFSMKIFKALIAWKNSFYDNVPTFLHGITSVILFSKKIGENIFDDVNKITKLRIYKISSEMNAIVLFLDKKVFAGIKLD